MNKKVTLFLIILIIYPFSLYCAENTSNVDKPQKIIIEEIFNPFKSTLFVASQLPYCKHEKQLVANFTGISAFEYYSNIPNRERYEKYDAMFIYGIGGYFVINKFGVGIELEFNIPKQRQYRNLKTATNSYIANDKKIIFNFNVGLGYKLLENLSIGFDFRYYTYYKTHSVDQLIGDDFSYNITEENILTGFSITYQPFTFLRFSYNIILRIQNLIAFFSYSKAGIPSLENYFKITFIPLSKKLYFNFDFTFSPCIGQRYDDVAQNLSWVKESIFNIFTYITYYFVKNTFAARAGFLFENIIREQFSYGDIAVLKPRYDMYTFLYGFSLGIIVNISKEVKITADFIYKSHRYTESGDINELADNTSYNTHTFYMNTVIKLP